MRFMREMGWLIPQDSRLRPRSGEGGRWAGQELKGEATEDKELGTCGTGKEGVMAIFRGIETSYA